MPARPLTICARSFSARAASLMVFHGGSLIHALHTGPSSSNSYCKAKITGLPRPCPRIGSCRGCRSFRFQPFSFSVSACIRGLCLDGGIRRGLRPDDGVDGPGHIHCNSFDLLSVISQFFFWEFTKLLVGGEGT